MPSRNFPIECGSMVQESELLTRVENRRRSGERWRPKADGTDERPGGRHGTAREASRKDQDVATPSSTGTYWEEGRVAQQQNLIKSALELSQ